MEDLNSAKIKIEQIIYQLDQGSCFSENGYLRNDLRAFYSDVERAAANGWADLKISSKYNDLGELVRKVAITFDLYALQVYKMLLPADLTKPQSCPLYRSAQNLIYAFPQLHSLLSPDDVLSKTLDIVLFSKLAILSYQGNSTLRIWVYSIMRRVVLQEARKENRIMLDFDQHAENKYLAGAQEQTEQKLEQAEQFGKQLQLLRQFIAKGIAQTGEGKNSPQLERAWIFWNDYCADIYILLEDDGSQNLPQKNLPFPIPPQELVLGAKGEHNLSYTNYLAWKIGKLRNWPLADIKDDLALQHTPSDKSRLRAAVRIRRNEAKKNILKELKNVKQSSTKKTDPAT